MDLKRRISNTRILAEFLPEYLINLFETPKSLMIRLIVMFCGLNVASHVSYMMFKEFRKFDSAILEAEELANINSDSCFCSFM